MIIHNPNMAGETLTVGIETKTGDLDGNFEFINDECSRTLLDTPGWKEGKNPKKKEDVQAPPSADPRVYITKLEAALEVKNSALAAAEASLKPAQDLADKLKAQLAEADLRIKELEAQCEALEAKNEELEAQFEPEEGEEEEAYPDQTWSKAQIKAYASERGVELNEKETKATMLAALEDAQA